MAVIIYQEVFWFQVPINNVLLMQVHQAVHDLNKVESSMLLTHSLDRLQVVEKLSAGAVVEHETHEVVGFETVVQLDDERVVEHRVNHFLVLNDVLLLVFGDKLLEHDFHCVELAIP